MDGHFENLGALIRLAAVASVAAPYALWSLGRDRGESRGAEIAGFAALAVLVGVLPSMLVFSRATGEPMVWMFGAEGLDTGVVEFATCGLFLAGAALAGLLGLRARGLARPAHLGLALAAFAVAGEEISWGQWIFHWRTPAELAAGNLQNETNLHNFVGPGGHEAAYALAGLGMLVLGVVAGVGRRRLPGLLAPAGFLRSSRVAPALVMVSATMMQHPFFQELAEVALAATLVYGLWANLAPGEGRPARGSTAAAVARA